LYRYASGRWFTFGDGDDLPGDQRPVGLALLFTIPHFVDNTRFN
jgi:hypothetical protein